MIDNIVGYFLIIKMIWLRYPFASILLSFWIYGANLLAIDFNNTQATPKDIDQALGWELRTDAKRRFICPECRGSIVRVH